MNIKTIVSTNENPVIAAQELKDQLSEFEFHTLIFFASYSYNAKELADQLQVNFEDKAVFGCSSYGEFIDGREEKKSIVAMAISKECIEDIKIEVLENVSKTIEVKGAFQNFEDYFGIKMSDADYKKYAGLLLIDGLTVAEERIIERIGDLTNVFFVGGSASDNLTFTHTYVYANGKAYEDAAVVALLKMKSEFAFIKTQSVDKTDKVFTVTKANTAKRELNELNNRPAAEFLSDLFNEPVDKLEEAFFDKPVGLSIGDDIYIRSLKTVEPDGSVTTFCSVEQGLDLTLLNIKDMVADTAKVLKEKEQELGSISGIINFNCLFRTLQLYNENAIEGFCKDFEEYPTIGFSTYGEIFLGHMNQTATMLVFK